MSEFWQKTPEFREKMIDIYGKDETVLARQETRHQEMYNTFCEMFPQDTPSIFSVPGRTEILGNHTDHNHGRVMAASVTMDVLAAAAPREENEILIYDLVYHCQIRIDLDKLAPAAQDSGAESLVRGCAAAVENRGGRTGGLSVCLGSEVLQGSGLSSSAAFEVMICSLLNYFYNDNKFTSTQLAQMSQYAENKYMGKPCGLMDQMACAYGGVIAIDFKNPESPVVEQLAFDLKKNNSVLLVVDTKGDHSELTPLYASIPEEMKQIAAKLETEVIGDLDEVVFWNYLKMLKDEFSDRSLLRVLHFFQENKKVVKGLEALKADNYDQFLELVNESGISSFTSLQNVAVPGDVESQPMPLALRFAYEFIKNKQLKGAVRVHGGGFAGTIQVFIEVGAVNEFTELMEQFFGSACVTQLQFRMTPAGFIY